MCNHADKKVSEPPTEQKQNILKGNMLIAQCHWASLQRFSFLAYTLLGKRGGDYLCFFAPSNELMYLIVDEEGGIDVDESVVESEK